MTASFFSVILAALAAGSFAKAADTISGMLRAIILPTAAFFKKLLRSGCGIIIN
jgi:hypothetical protein